MKRRLDVLITKALGRRTKALGRLGYEGVEKRDHDDARLVEEGIGFVPNRSIMLMWLPPTISTRIRGSSIAA